MNTSVEENKAVVKRWNEEIISGRKLEAFDQVLHPDYFNHSGSDGSWAITSQGLEQAKHRFGEVFQRAPGWQVVIEELIGEGDLVAVRGVYANEGKPVANFIGFYRFSDGKIVDNWYCSRQLDE
jgi:predicted SnoaL-like aldol condensation-catalyzing enzyme